jgi:hypothetical protein
MKSAREISWARDGIPAVRRTPARDRSMRLRMPIRDRSSNAPVAPADPTFPDLMAMVTSVAV